MNIFNDPLLYINWGSALIAIIAVRVFGNGLIKDVESNRPGTILIRIILLAIIVGGCLYISDRAGTIQIEKMIEASEKPKDSGQ